MRWSIVNFKVWSIHLYIFLRFSGRLRKVPESRGCLVWQFIVPSQTRRPAPFRPNLRWAHSWAQDVYCTGYFTLLLWRGDEALRVDLRNGYTSVYSAVKLTIGIIGTVILIIGHHFIIGQTARPPRISSPSATSIDGGRYGHFRFVSPFRWGTSHWACASLEMGMAQKHIHSPSVWVRSLRLLFCVGEFKVGFGARVGFRARTGLHLFFLVFLDLEVCWFVPP